MMHSLPTKFRNFHMDESRVETTVTIHSDGGDNVATILFFAELKVAQELKSMLEKLPFIALQQAPIPFP